MDLALNLDLLFLGIVSAATGILGFSVFFNNRQSITNKTFLLFSLITIFWGIFNYLNYKVQSPELVLWLLRLVIFLAVWHAFSIFQFFYVFPSERIKFSKLYRWFIIPAVLIVSLVTLTPLVFSQIQELSPIGQVSKVALGPGIILFGTTVTALIISGIVLLVRKTRRAQGIEKLQFRYVLLGTTITFSLIITFNFLLPVILDNVRFIPLGAVFIFPFIAFTFYAVVKHRLLNIRVISSEILVFVLSIVSLFEVVLATSPAVLIFRVLVFALLLIFGILLIRGVLREVEQRERMEKLSRELAEANQELRKLDRAKSEFISIASHQLRAPLTIIKGYISLILEGTMGAIADKGKKAINIISTSAEQLIKLVNDLLDLSRIESGKIKYEFAKGNLAALIKKVADDFLPSARAKNVSIMLDGLESPQEFSFDPDKIREVTINLLDNAVKYSPDNGKVAVRIEDAEDVLRVSVRDQGIGIKKEDLGKIFTKFARTEEAQRADPNGMGIGLYFVKRVVEDHGGKVWVESEGLGKGSTFFVELPLNK